MLRPDSSTVNYNCSEIPAATLDVYITKTFGRANYRIRQDVFREILAIAETRGIAPNTDAFSSKAHRRLPNYWSAHSDAFKKFWNTKILWINPPVKHLEKIVEKIFRDEAKGIILVPRWPDCAWFVALCYIAVDWWDYPLTTELFEDGTGRTLSTGLFPSFRVIIFDALGALAEYPDLPHPNNGTESKISVLRFFTDGIPPTPENRLQVSSAIESASPDPKSKALEEALRRRFDDVMEKPIYAKDIDPTIRGPFGVAKIELKEGAKPLHKKFFRCSGEREEALNAMIEKLISRGWIVPSKSEWTSQAFVVPKPPDSTGKKQWRLVLDYRYLNSQTKDDPFPLPLIEDLITKQSKNRIWSIFDLEDGFHQMHLHPESQEYTAFVTPHGIYQWTVLPMGVKNGPAMFQRMIQWALRDLTQVLVYIDDVLVGTPEPHSDPEVHQPKFLSLKNELWDILQLHFYHVSRVLEAFRRHRLFVKGAKMHLFMIIIKFCGHILSQGQRRAAPSKM